MAELNHLLHVVDGTAVYLSRTDINGPFQDYLCYPVTVPNGYVTALAATIEPTPDALEVTCRALWADGTGKYTEVNPDSGTIKAGTVIEFGELKRPVRFTVAEDAEFLPGAPATVTLTASTPFGPNVPGNAWDLLLMSPASPFETYRYAGYLSQRWASIREAVASELFEDGVRSIRHQRSWRVRYELDSDIGPRSAVVDDQGHRWDVTGYALDADAARNRYATIDAERKAG